MDINIREIELCIRYDLILSLEYILIDNKFELFDDLSYYINRIFKMACDYNRPNIIYFLIKHGADIHYYNEYALNKASEYGELELVKYYIENGADITTSDYEAFNSACFSGQIDVINYLLGIGADPNSNGKYSAMQLACKNNQLEVVKILLDHGAIITDFIIETLERKGYNEILNYLKK